MMIGIVGAPNKGKSTLFSALTANDVQMADYPFTTIHPNMGTAYARVQCAHIALGLQKCGARGGHCKGGMREIPVQLLDVAGLVPGAHEGKGMGNQFLDDLRKADALLQVIDASGRTDLEGNPCTDADLENEVRFLQDEIVWWIAGIIKRNWDKIRNRDITCVADALTGFGAGPEYVASCAREEGLPAEKINWTDAEVLSLAKRIAKSKPIIVIANKADVPGALGKARALGEKLAETGAIVRPCSAALERALRKASESGAIEYAPGDADFKINDQIDQKKKDALAGMRKFMAENGGTGIQQALHDAVFGALAMKVAYPVEDEHKASDHAGNVLPDALLLPKNATTLDLAAKIHTDLAQKFIGAIDVKSKMRVGKTHVLADGDIIKIVSGK